MSVNQEWTAIPSPLVAQASAVRGPQAIASATVPKHLKFGLVGYGYWGPQLARNFAAQRNASISYIADLDDGRLAQAAARFSATQLTRRFDDLLNRDVDAIIIATPVHTHYPLARAALLAGKHVFVEKPLAVAERDVEDLIELTQQRSLLLMVGYTFLYHPTVQELRRLMADGLLGKLYYIDTQRLNLGLFHRDINVIWDLGPHDVSILRYLLGADPVSVRTTGAAYIQPGIVDVAYAYLQYADGLIAHMQLSWLHPSKVRRLTAVGDRRMAIYDDVEPQDKLRIYNRGVDIPRPPSTFEEFQLSYRTGETIIPSIQFTEPLHVACEHFANCIRSGRSPITDGVWSLPITRTLTAIHRSLELKGQEVQV
ncbi:MAG: Gfo/Idh/MocA family protein [Ktedonobacterales bacterium]